MPTTPVIHASTRRQSLLRARAHRRRSGQGLRRGRRRGRDHLRVRPPHRRHQRAARHRRRLESGRAAPDRLPGHAGAAHDAEPVRQAPRAARSTRCASSPRTSAARSASRCTPTPTRWRRWRCRSCSSGRSSSSPTGSKASSPTSMPATIASTAKIGVKNDGTITAFEIDDLTGIGPYSVYPRTSGIEANQVVNLIGGPYTCAELQGARPRRVPEQERDVPVPRGRPSDRDRGHRGTGRAGRGQDRHGPAGDPPAQPDRRRRASLAGPSGHQVRGAVAPFERWPISTR